MLAPVDRALREAADGPVFRWVDDVVAFEEAAAQLSRTEGSRQVADALLTALDNRVEWRVAPRTPDRPPQPGDEPGEAPRDGEDVPPKEESGPFETIGSEEPARTPPGGGSDGGGDTDRSDREPAFSGISKAEAKDRRFAAPEWRENPLFDTIRQTYLALSDKMLGSVDEIDGLDEATRHKMKFAVKNFVDAMSPSNFAVTNPQVLKRTIETRGENLLKGLANMLKDIAAGQVTQSKPGAFEVGRNLATTPGKVIKQTPLYQLIQYTPTTEEVLDYLRNVSLASPLKRQIDFISAPDAVSSDFIGSRHASIADNVAPSHSAARSKPCSAWRPRTEALRLEETGLKCDKFLLTKPTLQTGVDHIFAAGDVAGPYQFTHFAAHQAWYAAVNALFGGEAREISLLYALWYVACAGDENNPGTAPNHWLMYVQVDGRDVGDPDTTLPPPGR